MSKDVKLYIKKSIHNTERLRLHIYLFKNILKEDRMIYNAIGGFPIKVGNIDEYDFNSDSEEALLFRVKYIAYN